MKESQTQDNWFFVDESGDPTFYDQDANLIVGQNGCSPILILGFIETDDPVTLRENLLELRREIVNDAYFKNVPSIKKTMLAFHAKDDLPEICYLVYKRLATLNYRTQFVVARKIERVFRNNFESKEQQFYNHLVMLLFQNVLHRYDINYIYFAKRGSRDKQQPLLKAINAGIARFESKWQKPIHSSIKLQVQTPQGEPCLSITDYMNWAVYRAYTRQEMRYYNVIANKVSLLVDLYDSQNYPNNWYSRKNPFDIKKVTPL